jgi:HEAT repeat protein
MKINPRNRFFYSARNLDNARNFTDREDYEFLGPRAALLDLQSPVNFEGAFKYLSGNRSYSDELRKKLKNPNTAIRLKAMKLFNTAGLETDGKFSWRFLESDNFIHRALALEAFSRAGQRSGCRNAIRSLTSTDALFINARQDSRARSIRYSLLTETALAIGRRCDASSKPDIMKLLKASSPNIRLTGACLLGLLGIREEMEGITEAMAHSGLFKLASEALASAASEDDIEKLYGITEKAPSGFIPLAVISSFDSPAATSSISKALSHSDRSVRLSAVHALGHSWSRDATGLLIHGLSDPDPAVRSGAAGSLARLNRVPDAMDEIKALLMQGPPADRAEAIAELAGAAPDDIIPLLTSRHGAIREAALRRLAEMEAGGLRDHLKTALSDNDENVRTAALEIIAERNMRDMASLSAPFIKKGGPETRVAAIAAASLDGRLMLGNITKALADRDPRIRAAAAKALGRTEHKDAIKTLRVLLGDTDRSVRFAAIRALGNLRDRNSDLSLRTVLDDPDPEIRIAALISIASVGERVAIDTMAEEAARTSHYVDTLIKASEVLEDSGLTAYLLGALSIPWEGDRSRIYKSLARVGSVEYIYRQLAATGDELAFRTLRTGKHFQDDLSLLTGERDDYAQGAGHYLMAMKARSRGDVPATRISAGKAYRYAKGSGHGALAVASLIMKAEAELGLEKPGAAISTLKKADKWLARTSKHERLELYSDLELAARLPLMLGQASLAKGDKEKAMEHYRKALSRAALDSLLSASPEKHKSSVIPEARKALESLQGI